MSKSTPIDQPTRHTVESLLRALAHNGIDWAEHRALDEELEDLKKRLLNTPQFKALAKRRDKAYRAAYAKRSSLCGGSTKQTA
jgi:hypothetical protein